MLPVFPIPNEKVKRLLDRIMESRLKHYMGLFGDCPRRPVREGDGTAIARKDGSEEHIDFHKISVESTWHMRGTDHITMEEALRQIDEMAKKLAVKQEEMMFFELNRQLPPEQIIDASDRPLDGVLLEEMLEKISIEFDENDQPIMPSIITSPETAKQLLGKKDELELDPDSRQRMDAIIAKKRTEYHAREANRRLVD